MLGKKGQQPAKERRPPIASPSPTRQKLIDRPLVDCHRLQNDLGYGIVRSAMARHAARNQGDMKRSGITVLLLGLIGGIAWATDPPCDAYPKAKQPLCAEIWKDLNKEDGPAIAQFGLDQLKRREAGQITAEQHLAQNMGFIKQSTAKRLERLRERMAKK